jgi:hypothetical protein
MTWLDLACLASVCLHLTQTLPGAAPRSNWVSTEAESQKCRSHSHQSLGGGPRAASFPQSRDGDTLKRVRVKRIRDRSPGLSLDKVFRQRGSCGQVCHVHGPRYRCLLYQLSIIAAVCVFLDSRTQAGQVECWCQGRGLCLVLSSCCLLPLIYRADGGAVGHTVYNSL